MHSGERVENLFPGIVSILQAARRENRALKKEEGHGQHNVERKGCMETGLFFEIHKMPRKGKHLMKSELVGLCWWI